MGQPALDLLVSILDLEQVDDDHFRGVSPTPSPTRVFGGQVASQALVAAARTVPDDRAVHSLHSYFIRGGDPRLPIDFHVQRVRDGHGFTTRRVDAVQRGEVVFTLSASFARGGAGPEHAAPMPDVAPPEELPSLAERFAGHEHLSALAAVARLNRPVDVRYVDDPPWAAHGTSRPLGRTQVWMRPDGVLPDSSVLRVCVLAWASDLTLLDAVLAAHGLYWGVDRVMGASLDHAMWFHRTPPAGEWVLYDCESPAAGGSRGLALGRFFARDGTLLATTVQEGLLRVPGQGTAAP
ncbi:acyl-CoA thioesterase II [Rhodococcus aerolatus]